MHRVFQYSMLNTYRTDTYYNRHTFYINATLTDRHTHDERKILVNKQKCDTNSVCKFTVSVYGTLHTIEMPGRLGAYMARERGKK